MIGRSVGSAAQLADCRAHRRACECDRLVVILVTTNVRVSRQSTIPIGCDASRLGFGCGDQGSGAICGCGQGGVLRVIWAWVSGTEPAAVA